MTQMNVSVVLRLIDELTKPARDAAKSMENLQKRLEDVSKRAAPAFDAMPKALRQTAQEARKTADAVGRMGDRYRSVAGAVQSLKNETNGLSRSPGVKAQTQQLNAMARAARSAATAVSGIGRAMGRVPGLPAGGGGGGGGGGRRGGGNGGPRSWYTGRAHGGNGHFGVEGAMRIGAAFMGLHQAKEFAKTGLEQAFSVQQTSAMLQAQGESQETIKRANDLARRMSVNNPQFSTAQSLHAIAELRPAMIGGIEEAMHLAPDFQKAVGVLEAVKDTHAGLKAIDSRGEALDMARFIELKGVNKDGEAAIRGYMDSMTKAIVAFNGQITAGDFHAAAKFGRGATRGWSQEFVEQFLPTIMNDIKGKGGTATGAGNALASFSRTIVDRVMTAGAAGSFFNLGLVDRDKVTRNKKGQIVKIQEGGIKNWQTAMANPYRWMQDTLIPALVKANGGKMPEESVILSKLGALFGNRVAQQLANILTVQKEQLEKDAKNVRDAMGINAGKFMMDNSPVAQMQAFAAAFRDMAGALAGPAAGPALRAMKGIGDIMREVSAWGAQSERLQSLGTAIDKFMEALFHQRWKGGTGYDDPNAMTPAIPDDGKYKNLYVLGDRLHDAFGRVTDEFLSIGDRLTGRLLSQLDFTVDSLVGIGTAAKTVAGYLSDAGNWLRSKLGWMGLGNGDRAVPGPVKSAKAAVPSIAGMFDPGSAVPNPANKPWYREKSVPDATLDGPGRFHFGGTGTTGGFTTDPVPGHLRQQLEQLPTATVPDLSDIGTRIMQGVADGMIRSKSIVTGQMDSLMGQLRSIAAAGIDIPVRVQTDGVASQVQGAIQRASAARPSISAPVHVNVHGAKDPKAVAKEVQSVFRDNVDNHLNDIA